MQNSGISLASSTNAGLPEQHGEGLKISVLGSGAFGTAMAVVAARRQIHEVILWGRDVQQMETIQQTRRNPRPGLSDFELPSEIVATNDLELACRGADILILCLPAQKIPSFFVDKRSMVEPHTLLCNTAKGLYVPTRELLSDAILGSSGLDRPDQPFCVLSGPSFAVEILQEMPTAVVVASKLLRHAVKVQRALSSSTSFRIYSSQDLVGVQLGGALKNPLAVGAGMIEGTGYGINTLAAYVTRSSYELRQLSIAMGGHPDTITGLSGVGDLMLTAFGSLSRNRNLGKKLMEEGYESLERLLQEKTVEGVPTAKVAVYYADECGLEAPIFHIINKLLEGEVKPQEAQALLMNRPLRAEH